MCQKQMVGNERCYKQCGKIGATEGRLSDSYTRFWLAKLH